MGRAVAMAAATVVAGVLALNYSGFCYRDLRWMSDQEYIDLAIAERISRLGLRERFDTVEQFKAAYPECCRLRRFGGGVAGRDGNRLNPLLFQYRVIVELRYEELWEGGLRNYLAYVGVTKCGWPAFENGIGV